MVEGHGRPVEDVGPRDQRAYVPDEMCPRRLGSGHRGQVGEDTARLVSYLSQGESVAFDLRPPLRRAVVGVDMALVVQVERQASRMYVPVMSSTTRNGNRCLPGAASASTRAWVHGS